MSYQTRQIKLYEISVVKNEYQRNLITKQQAVEHLLDIGLSKEEAEWTVDKW